jgi:hypothetical protein
MLPNFLVIGVQKAGSSWLAERIGDHPDVFMAAREADFFNDHFKEGLEWYEKKFSDWSGEKCVGEGSPGYISHPLAAGRIRSSLGAALLHESEHGCGSVTPIIVVRGQSRRVQACRDPSSDSGRCRQ